MAGSIGTLDVVEATTPMNLLRRGQLSSRGSDLESSKDLEDFVEQRQQV
jgi:hypothetical protein